MPTLNQIRDERHQLLDKWFGDWLATKPPIATFVFPFSYETDVRAFASKHSAECGEVRHYESRGGHMRQMQVTRNADA